MPLFLSTVSREVGMRCLKSTGLNIAKDWDAENETNLHANLDPYQPKEMYGFIRLKSKNKNPPKNVKVLLRSASLIILADGLKDSSRVKG